ncbi:MAG: potassium-transporting ATPase subunit KdpC [Azospirillum sp.]|nr:potassium-transporting ATPase subunit KdpC [Azospirillum sp.]
MLQALIPATRLLLVLTVLCGIAYPLVVTGVAQLVFPHQARGSLIVQDDRVVGSELIGRSFVGPGWFHSRPSATAPAPYNAAASGASNAAPTRRAFIDEVKARIEGLRAENPDAAGPVPVELVTASGSGLDPDLTPAGALFQVPRIAKLRGIGAEQLRGLVAEFTEGRTLGLFGQPRVKVLRLNLELDKRWPLPK